MLATVSNNVNKIYHQSTTSQPNIVSDTSSTRTLQTSAKAAEPAEFLPYPKALRIPFKNFWILPGFASSFGSSPKSNHFLPVTHRPLLQITSSKFVDNFLGFSADRWA